MIRSQYEKIPWTDPTDRVPLRGERLLELKVVVDEGRLAGAGHHLAPVKLRPAAGGEPGLQVIFHFRLVVTAIVQTSVLLPREDCIGEVTKLKSLPITLGYLTPVPIGWLQS